MKAIIGVQMFSCAPDNLPLGSVLQFSCKYYTSTALRNVTVGDTLQFSIERESYCNGSAAAHL